MTFVGNTQDGLEMVRKLVDLGGEIKVTKIIKTGFNEMEGNCYTVRIKATAPVGKVWTSNKREKLLFMFETNSTWIEPDDGEYDENYSEKDLIKDMVYGCCL